MSVVFQPPLTICIRIEGLQIWWLTSWPRDHLTPHCGATLILISFYLTRNFFNGPFPASFYFCLLSFLLVFKTWQMSGFKPRISGVRSNRSTNWATTTAHIWLETLIISRIQVELYIQFVKEDSQSNMIFLLSLKSLLPSLEEVDVVELVEVNRGFDGGLHLGDASRDQLLKIRVTSSSVSYLLVTKTLSGTVRHCWALADPNCQVFCW